MNESDNANYSIIQPKEEPCDSSSEVESRDVTMDILPFLCEACESIDGKSFMFKKKEHLLVHTLKRHPTTCIECFETLENSEELKLHADAVGHEQNGCRHCYQTFGDKDEMSSHACERKDNSSLEAGEGSDNEDEIIVYNIKKEEVSDNDEWSPSGEDNSGEEDDDKDDETLLSCLHCSTKGLRAQAELRNHTGVEHATVCCVCFESFDDVEALDRHHKSMNHSVWHCQECKLTFVIKTNYRSHMAKCHPLSCPFRCTKCDCFGSFSENIFIHHMRSKHGKQKVTDSIEMDDLLKSHWDIDKTMCNICHIQCWSTYSLILHIYKEHNDPSLTHVYKCESCNFGFGNGIVFEHHLKKYHADDTEYLKEARTRLETSLKRACPLCSFTGPNLFKHIRHSHPSFFEITCNICGKKFPDENYLRRHKYVEHGAATYLVCPEEGCGLKMTYFEMFIPHLRKKHGYVGMTSLYCFTHKRKFCKQCKLEDHIKCIHRDKSLVRKPAPKILPCDICGKKFANKNSVKTHKDTIHSKNVKRDTVKVNLK